MSFIQEFKWKKAQRRFVIVWHAYVRFLTVKFFRAKCRRIWDGYQEFHKQQLLRRRGLETHGFCDSERVVNPFDQNIMEHSSAFANLLFMFRMTFPEFGELSVPELYAALVHDYAETVIGDIPDDGSAEATKNKDAIEREIIMSYLKRFSATMADAVMEKIKELQDKNTLMYACDKLDWIFENAVIIKIDRVRYADFEFSPYAGLGFKRDHYGLTDQDKHAIEVTGSQSAIDAAVVHFMEHTVGIPGREFFIGIIQEMYFDLIGNIPSWMYGLY